MINQSWMFLFERLNNFHLKIRWIIMNQNKLYTIKNGLLFQIMKKTFDVFFSLVTRGNNTYFSIHITNPITSKNMHKL